MSSKIFPWRWRRSCTASARERSISWPLGRRRLRRGFLLLQPGRVQRMVFINPGAYENTRSLYAKQLSGPMGGYFAGRMSRFQNGEKYLKRQLLDQTMLTDRDIEEFCRPYTRNGVRICTRLATVNYLEEDLERAAGSRLPGAGAIRRRRWGFQQKDTQAFCDTLRNAYFMEVHGCGALPHFEKAGARQPGNFQIPVGQALKRERGAPGPACTGAFLTDCRTAGEERKCYGVLQGLIRFGKPAAQRGGGAARKKRGQH